MHKLKGKWQKVEKKSIILVHLDEIIAISLPRKKQNKKNREVERIQYIKNNNRKCSGVITDDGYTYDGSFL